MKTSDISQNQGKTDFINNKPVAVYKDENGNLTVLENVCTHAGCQTNWNPDSKTWDCPCHNSIFQKDGTVVQGPAIKPLPRIPYKIENDEIILS